MNVEILLILDRSGSMEPLAADVIHAYNGFIEKQLEAPDARQSVMSLTLFGSRIDHRFQSLPLLAAPRLTVGTYPIEGMTALHDALGETLGAAFKRIQSENWADAVLVAIVTDGEENASHLWTRAQVKALVARCMEAGWQFLFLGAGINAQQASTKIGIDPQYAFDVKASGQGIDEAFKLIGHHVLLLEGPRG